MTRHHSHQQQQQQQHNSAIRTIYLGNVKNDLNISDIMDQVKTGQIQSIRLLPEKNGLFITFIESNAAAQFYYENKTFVVKGHELKIGWGKPSHLTNSVQAALQNGASRNVYLGLLDQGVTEDEIRQNLSRFGHIEKIKLIPEKRIAFIHYLCISNAVKCVNTLQTESQWQSKRVNFGKDRCAPSSTPTTSPIQPQLQQQQKFYILPASTAASPTTPNSSNGYHPFLHHHHHQPLLIPAPLPPPPPPHQQLIQNNTSATGYDIHTGLPILQYHHPHAHPQQQLQAQHQLQHHHQSQHQQRNSLGGVASRTIYIGNIHPDTTSEDICNVVRGGILSQIRFMPDKHIAFITFVDPILAESFYNSTDCLVIKNRRLKLGWGKPSSLPLTVMNAVQNGGSRNVYIGNIDDLITKEKLKHDFSEYGDIELVNTLKEKNCAFVNFTSIAGAVRAIEGIRSREEYKKFRINYGKDRCGNPPKYPLQQQQGNGTMRNGGGHHGGGSSDRIFVDIDHDDEEEEEVTDTATTTTSNITTPNNSYSSHKNNKSVAAEKEAITVSYNSNDQQITSSASTSPIVANIKLY